VLPDDLLCTIAGDFLPPTVHFRPVIDSTYGALRVQAELVARGLPCGHHRVARLMRQAGLVGCHRRRPLRVRTTRRDPAAAPAPDLVERSFTAPGPDRLWMADITYLPTAQEGFLYLAVILDAFSRRVVGWSMQAHLQTELVLAALEMAVGKRRPEGGADSPLGSRMSVHLRALWRAVCGSRHSLLHGDGGRLLR
jgi:transposase InsO family protein